MTQRAMRDVEIYAQEVGMAAGQGRGGEKVKVRRGYEL